MRKILLYTVTCVILGALCLSYWLTVFNNDPYIKMLAEKRTAQVAEWEASKQVKP